MTRTDAEKREYMRGYNRGRARYGEHAQRLLHIVQGYRSRLADADSARICQGCDRWTRGQPNCQWGICRADFEWSAEPRMWTDPHDSISIVTQPNFGCVSWIPIASRKLSSAEPTGK